MRNKDAVEWVLVSGGQEGDSGRMRIRNRRLTAVGLQEVLSQHLRIDEEVLQPEAVPDGNFPNRYRIECPVGTQDLDKRPQPTTNPFCNASHLQQYVRV